MYKYTNDEYKTFTTEYERFCEMLVIHILATSISHL